MAERDEPIAAAALPAHGAELPHEEPPSESELIARALEVAGTPGRLAEWVQMPIPALGRPDSV